MAKIRLRKFDGGLWLSSPPEAAPTGTMRRNSCAHPLSRYSIRSRKGSSVIRATGAKTYAITKFTDVWFDVSSSSLYRDGVIIKTGLSFSTTSLPQFVCMPPRAGLSNYLFFCGAGDSVKIDRSDTELVNDEKYKWTASGSGTNEYYLELLGGGDPEINEPESVQEDDDAMTEGTLGSLAEGEWKYGDNDTLGYDTVYVRLSDSDDPDNKANGYLTCTYVTQWGITDPDTTAITNVPTAGGGSGDDNVKLLLHFDGADASTTFTDDSQTGHTVTAHGNAQLDTAFYKFGTASGIFDGTGDYLTIPDHTDFTLTGGIWTIDFWMRRDTNNFSVIYSQGIDSGSNIQLQLNHSEGGEGSIRLFIVANSGSKSVGLATAPGVVPLSSWKHVEIGAELSEDDKRPYSYYIFINGIKRAFANSIAYCQNYTSYVRIGSDYTGADPFEGHIDEFRLSNGILRHNDNFTVPTSAYEVAGGGTTTIGDLEPGTYKYKFTYKNSITGNRSNGSVEVEDEVESTDLGYVELSEIPESSDPQVDRVEIWRTGADGTAYFKLTEIDNGTTSYTDMNDDSILSSTELPTDNLEPYDWFDDCIYHNASAFWITHTEEGEMGRVYYSPVGRPESVQGFINVTDDDDGLQRLVYFGGTIGVFSKKRFFQILGSNPYTIREITGVTGTTYPSTVVTTPRGIMYATHEGIRLIVGIQSRLIGEEAVERLFDGDSVENLSAFTPFTATYGRNEYYVSDGNAAGQTLAYNLEKNTWRDLGWTSYIMYYDEAEDIMAIATTLGTIYDFEKTGETDDAGEGLPLDVEPAHVLLNSEKDIVVQYVHIDADTSNEELTVKIILDGTETSIGTLQTSSRSVTTFPVGKVGKVAGIRINATIDDEVEIFGIDIEIPDTAQERT